ncbi:dopamine receptor 2 [Elysia marginata]|uniref:Dopamine receptor 2 n=1 Tax=Elysia marginata TaxID=1093978 RepID=A0AAV4HG72_9GAST|nr:dopamine receptor 2 [Elysia marginata]
MPERVRITADSSTGGSSGTEGATRTYREVIAASDTITFTAKSTEGYYIPSNGFQTNSFVSESATALTLCQGGCKEGVSSDSYMHNFTTDSFLSDSLFGNQRAQEEQEDVLNVSTAAAGITFNSPSSPSPDPGYDIHSSISVGKALFSNLSFSTDYSFTTLPVNESSSDSPLLYEISNPVVGVLLAIFSLIVVIGNVMVIIAVFKEIYLRTVTNYFIVSLAIADVMVGGVVMPFSISNEMTRDVWLYGQAWCDLWRSLDVLASTASILNLCVISLDRYWAITDPIAYPSKMSNGKVCILIMLVWFCSAGISFPAIAWWRSVTPADLEEHKCMFTEDSAYLIISALVSFYIPMFIMMFVYVRIYRAAMAQTEGIKSGSKVTSDCPLGDNGEQMTLRIHRGGYRLRNEPSNTPAGSFRTHHRSSDSDGDSPVSSTRLHVYHHNNHNNHQYHNPNTNTGNNHHHHHHHHHTPRSTTFISKKIRHFALSKKITKLAREQKAAKTLGIVVGVFIICWLPFFCTTVLLAICRNQCVYRPDILFPVFTWLGYINSGMNPIIYALSMRDFRRAFSKMILCCPRYRYSQTQRHTYSQTNSLSTSSFSVSCGDRCVAMRI